MKPFLVPAALAAGAVLTLGPAFGVAAAATPGSTSPAPDADQSSQARLSLTPNTGAPGSTTKARLACLNGDRAIQVPDVFQKTRTAGAAGALLETYTVSKNATPGTYTVHGTCGDNTLSVTYTVTEPAGANTPTQEPTHGATHEQSSGPAHRPPTHGVGQVPAGAPATGGGGTAGAQNPWVFGLGGAAVAGAGATAALAIRRHRASSDS
jgi:hypothetical protein